MVLPAVSYISLVTPFRLQTSLNVNSQRCEDIFMSVPIWNQIRAFWQLYIHCWPLTIDTRAVSHSCDISRPFQSMFLADSVILLHETLHINIFWTGWFLNIENAPAPTLQIFRQFEGFHIYQFSFCSRTSWERGREKWTSCQQLCPWNWQPMHCNAEAEWLAARFPNPLATGSGLSAQYP